MAISSRILQIVPRAPGSYDGVGDYALKLAQRLRSDYARETTFAAAVVASGSRVENFDIVAPLAIAERECANCRDVILHYVNYGYHTRGLPMQLPSLLRRLKQTCGGRLVTIFHELYASAPPWRSAFWLQPAQKSIARAIARLSDACVVSSETMRDLLRQLSPASDIAVHPVVSPLGEPIFPNDQFVRRNPHRWVIFGGTHLLQRSLGTFRHRLPVIPELFSPHELYVLGGDENPTTRHELGEIRGITCHYRPRIEASVASEILSSCSFGWIDYFRQHDVPTAAILKSGSFASYCAHGVIPILPHEGSVIALQGDQLPGPYFIETNRAHLPTSADRAVTSVRIVEWYRRQASVEHLAKGIATLLQLKS
jgi:hypothetical protein